MGQSAVKPDVLEQPSFDSTYGFSSGRKERVMKLSQQEMEAAKIPLEFRDYCAHLLLENYVCRRREFPWLYKCHHEEHNYMDCQYQDYVLRMKEYEREKRLLERQRRKEQ